MIVLLGCSINLSATNIQHSSTGVLDEHTDSVLIAYDDLRIANSKMLELEYEKEINGKLKEVIANDSIIIAEYSKANIKLKQDCNKAVNQRNILLGTICGAIIAGVLLVFIK